MIKSKSDPKINITTAQTLKAIKNCKTPKP